MFTSAERVADQANVADCDTAQATMQSSKAEIPPSSRQLSSKNDWTEAHPPPRRAGSRVVKQQKKTACNIPASVHNVDNLIEVNSSMSEDRENVIRRSETTAKPQKQQLSKKIFKNFDLDVLLTPLSEGRLLSHVKPRHSVPNVRLTPLFVDSTPLPDDSSLTPRTVEITKPHALALTHVSKDDGQLNSCVEMDVIESTVPKSVEVGRACSLIPLQVLSQNNMPANDDTEIDVFFRSFWDEGSDTECSDFNPVVELSDLDDRRVGSRLTKKVTASKKKENGASNTVDKKSKKPQSKSKRNCCKSSGGNQKGSEADDGVLRCCGMTLRPRKKVKVDDAGQKASYRCKRQLHGSVRTTKKLTRTPKGRSRSAKTQRRTRKNSKKPSEKVQTEVAPVAANGKIARKRGCSLLKSTSPLLSCRAINRCDRKRPQSARKCVLSNASVKAPCKKQKLCNKAAVTESIKCKPHVQQSDNNTAVRCSSRLRAVRPAASQEITSIASKQSERTRNTSGKKTRSVKQTAKNRASDRQKTGAGKATPTLLTDDRENVNTTATKPLHSGQIKPAGDGESSVGGKKSRSVGVSLSCIL